MTMEEFEKLADGALKKLPAEFRARLDNVVVTVREVPSAAQAARFGPGLLGLYEGVPLADRGTSYSGVMPDKITLFKDNIEAGRSGAAAVEALVRHTLLHEIAHHFGISDEELIRKGLY